MIELYTWDTPNGRKISIMLEECRLPYNVHKVDLGKGEQFTPEFVALNPNNKIPVIVDSDGPENAGKPITLMESGAILIYLAGKTGKFLPKSARGKYKALEWLMFQMGGVGPMFGQLHVFLKSAEPVPDALERYTREKDRLYGVLDRRLGEVKYLAGEYSIADIATYPWVARHNFHKVDFAAYPNVKRWFDAISARPAVVRGWRCRLYEVVVVIPFQRQALHEPERVASLENLELLRCGPEANGSPPLLFVHGAFAGAWCWAEHFMPYFAQAGYCCYALSLRGHGESAGRGQISLHSVRHYVDDLAQAIEHIGMPPVVIGHSMGGLVAQKYLEHAALPAMVLVASVPPHGLMPASVSLALLKPQLMNELNGLLFTGRASLQTMRQALFAGPIAVDRLSRYYRLMQPESPRVIWDMTFFDLPQLWRIRIPPLLVLGAERDVMVPPQQVELCAQTYGTRAEIFPGMGHAMMLDVGWQGVADRIIGWLGGL